MATRKRPPATTKIFLADFPTEVHREMKTEAARRGTPLKALYPVALREWLDRLPKSVSVVYTKSEQKPPYEVSYEVITKQKPPQEVSVLVTKPKPKKGGKPSGSPKR
jgi:hypothetical protein